MSVRLASKVENLVWLERTDPLPRANSGLADIAVWACAARLPQPTQCLESGPPGRGGSPGDAASHHALL